MICKNCQQKFKGNFCSNCGQKSTIDRINLPYLLKQLSSNVLKLDRGFFFTLKELLFRPGHSIREFLAGKRKAHFKPLAFFLIITTTFVFYLNFGIDNTAYDMNVDPFISNSSGNKVINTDRIFFFFSDANNIAITTLLLLPLFALCSFLVFKKSYYNYYEHLIVNIYITSIIIVILGVFEVITSFFENLQFIFWIQIIPSILGLIYTLWVYVTFFSNRKNKWNTFFLALIVFFLNQLVFYFVYGYLLHLLV